MGAYSSLLMSLLTLLIALSMQGCASKPLNQDNVAQNNAMTNKQAAIDDSKIAKVKIDQAGRIFLNEKQVSLDELKAAFARLKQAGGVVWYYRENPVGEPSAEAMSVIQAIVDARLPVRLSSKPDYSDVVSPDGRSNSAP